MPLAHTNDPYAPPKAEADPRPKKRSDFADERRSVPLLLLLTVATLGIYPAIWFVRRQKFLDSLDAEQKLGNFAWGYLGLLVVVFLYGIAEGLGAVPSVGSGLNGGIGAIAIITAFRVRKILQSHFSRTGRFIGISGVATFFFGALYLQHVINKAADDPGRKKKRRRKKRPIQ